MTLHSLWFLLIEVLALWGLLAYVVGAIRYAIPALLWQSISFVGLAGVGILYYVSVTSNMLIILLAISTIWYLILDRRVVLALSQRSIRHSQLLRFRKL
jgi:hypothetical protein